MSSPGPSRGVNRARKTAGAALAAGARGADPIGGEVERDGGRQAEHDQQDDEPDAQEVVAELLGGDDPPAGVRDALLGRGVGPGCAGARRAVEAPCAALMSRLRRRRCRRIAFGLESGPLDRRPLDGGAIDVVERRDDRPERGQAQAVLDRGDEDGLADARLGDRPGGRGRARARAGSVGALDRLDRRERRAASCRGPLDVGRRAAARGRPRWRRCRHRTAWPAPSTVPTPIEPARGEDPDPVADRLDLAQQVARQHDRRGRAR